MYSAAATVIFSTEMFRFDKLWVSKQNGIYIQCPKRL